MLKFFVKIRGYPEADFILGRLLFLFQCDDCAPLSEWRRKVEMPF